MPAPLTVQHMAAGKPGSSLVSSRVFRERSIGAAKVKALCIEMRGHCDEEDKDK